ncbi:MAG: deoxyhypusine synthase [Nitrososphaerota archaeon]
MSRKSSDRATGRPVIKDYSVGKSMTLEELVSKYGGSGGFMSAYLAQGVEILERMISDRECVRWLSFVGSLVATGLRGVLADIVRTGIFKYVVTTCGALDHDIARSFNHYYVGAFEEDDSRLAEEGLHRVGSVVIPEENYGLAVERFMLGLLDELYGNGVRELGTIELSRQMGVRLPEGSILRAAADAEVNIVVPGIMDGAVGTQLWIYHTTHRDFRLNLFRDYELLSDIMFKDMRRGGLIIGGGISKHHLLWLNHFAGGLNYAIYITTGNEWDGSLTGAPLREAISWRKLRKDANKITIYGDATVMLPILASVLFSKVPERPS